MSRVYTPTGRFANEKGLVNLKHVLTGPKEYGKDNTQLVSELSTQIIRYYPCHPTTHP
jgi:hypothetical protein